MKPTLMFIGEENPPTIRNSTVHHVQKLFSETSGIQFPLHKTTVRKEME